MYQTTNNRMDKNDVRIRLSVKISEKSAKFEPFTASKINSYKPLQCYPGINALREINIISHNKLKAAGHFGQIG